MKIFILFFASLSLSLPAYADNLRVEDAAQQTYNDLLNGKFDTAEKRLNQYMSENAQTRHGTDKALETFSNVLKLIDKNKAHEKWQDVEIGWEKAYPNSFTQEFFKQQYRHSEAIYFTERAEEKKLLQSQVRKYKDVMGHSYNRFLKTTDSFPNKWRIHAYLAKNYKKYKLTASELNTHFQIAQRLNKGELLSIEGYISSLSPNAFGRDDRMIAKGIESILAKYPDRNLSKPEYIDASTKKEIEDQIFEFTIGRMLITARKYVEKSPPNSAASSLIPMTYEIIFHDLEQYYGLGSTKIEQNPLSYKRKAVWQEIESQYKALIQRFPNSGRYLSSYLKIALDQDQLDTAKTIAAALQKNDPNYAPEITAPLQCDFYARLKGNARDNDLNTKMYHACKTTAEYSNEETSNYRAGWAARQIRNFEESNAFIEKALKASPQNPAYLTDICWNYKDLKQYSKALDYCDKAITADRSHARAWLGRSHINYHGFNNVAQSQKDAQVYKSLTNKDVR